VPYVASRCSNPSRSAVLIPLLCLCPVCHARLHISPVLMTAGDVVEFRFNVGGLRFYGDDFSRR
jgi:hypothetical protein